MSIGSSKITVSVDISKAAAMLNAVSIAMKPKTYLKQVGQDLLKWVNDNFKGQGIETKWAPLSPNTLAARRMMGRGGQILMDSRDMSKSFTSVVDESSVAVGTQDQKALWHEKGTSPYFIPVGAKGFLAFKTARLQSTGLGPYRGKARSKGEILKRGWTYTRKGVNHPGLAARPMLPSESKGRDLAMKTLDAYINKIVNDANAKGGK